MKIISKKAGVSILSLIFLIALISAVPVEAKVPCRWDISANYTFEPEWTGTVTREDGTSGIITLDIINWEDLNYIQKSDGIWRIEWDGGEYIEGTHHGKVSWKSGDYVANGYVTETSDAWAHLNDRQIHIMGNIDLSSFPYSCTAIMQIN
ncbi:MAG: hypothetical protein RTV31_01340 [Candidatus Thorarchaeota archaeon]